MIIEALEYDGPILMLYQWAQESLDCHFLCIHCGVQMMVDTDGLNCNADSITAQHLCVSALLHQVNAGKRLITYINNIENISKLTKINLCTNKECITIARFINEIIITCSATAHVSATKDFIDITLDIYPSQALIICSVSILLYNAPPSSDNT